MLRIMGLLVVVIAGISCDGRSGKADLPPGGGTVVQSDGPESRMHHPAEHSIRTVPVLIGMPSEKMWDEMRRGEVLLGGCVGSPDLQPPAKVCERCRMWKTDEMKYWQPLPEEFGELAAKNGG